MVIPWPTDKAYLAHCREEYDRHKRFAQAVRARINKGNPGADPLTELYHYHNKLALEWYGKIKGE